MMGLGMTPQQYDLYALDSRHYACAEALLCILRHTLLDNFLSMLRETS